MANHQLHDNAGLIQHLIVLLRTPSKEIQVEACHALRFLFNNEKCRSNFLNLQGHVDISRCVDAIEPEITRERIAALWNLSISYQPMIDFFHLLVGMSF